MTQTIMRVVAPVVALLVLLFGTQVPAAQGGVSNNVRSTVVASTTLTSNTKPVSKPLTAAQKRAIHIRHLEALAKRHKYVIKAYRISGIKASAYRGRYYDPRFETFRKCVIKRESEGNYWSVEHSSHAGGAYQFMPSWTKTIQHWTGEYVPIWWMDRYAQDYAFWRALNHGKGIGNWAGGRWHC